MRAGDFLRLGLAFSSVNAVRFVGGMSKSGGNLVCKHHIKPEYGDEQADAGRDCRNRLANIHSCTVHCCIYRHHYAIA